MTFGETISGDAIVVQAGGRIDLSNAEAFRARLESAVARAPAGVIVDMAGVDYISSGGLRAMMIAFRAAKAADRRFAVAALAPLVLEIFTISRFDKVFPVYGGVSDALEALSPGGLGKVDAS